VSTGDTALGFRWASNVLAQKRRADSPIRYLESALCGTPAVLIEIFDDWPRIRRWFGF
jgi:hypothetical protein